MCLIVIPELQQGEGLGPLGLQIHAKNVTCIIIIIIIIISIIYFKLPNFLL